ncbi:MAG: DNA/RNA nuclease SfsA [Bdellovibrionota bacterium]
MNFNSPLLKGKIIKRYKRFLADVELESGELVTAHCPNTGSMKTCWKNGDTIYLSYHDNPQRKLKYTWEYTKVKKGYIGINTMRPNQIVFEAIEKGQIHQLNGYETIRREVKYGSKSKIDILLETDQGKVKKKCWVEIKNVTMYLDDRDLLVFPDAVTARGLKHIKELENQVKGGDRAVMFFLANRPEGKAFTPAKEIDPEYADALKKSQKNGVEILCYRVKPSLKGMTIGEEVPISI